MFHEPVLKREVIELLLTDENGIYLDGTVGGAGHAQAILDRLGSRGRLIGLDLDDDALRFARRRLRAFREKLTLHKGNFKDMVGILERLNIGHVHGILLDLGISSHQIDTPGRGFSYRQEGPLDMRLNSRQKFSAFEIVNAYSEQQLCEIFRTYGEEKRARAIAHNIIKERKKSSIISTQDLRDLVSQAVPERFLVKSLARIFQALRMAVNDELNNLSAALRESVGCLHQGCRLVVISYNSLEDRMVKTFFKKESVRCVCPPELPVCVCGQPGRLQVLTRRVVRPAAEEVRVNPRSRSARLRAAERLNSTPKATEERQKA
ncbi:MAG: 16S rRNA (cytosine(1402)-N(4))-methyltransferase RsmH [bacterium]